MTFPEYKTDKPAIWVKGTLDLLFQPGEVFEVRVPKTKYGTISGYFNDTAIAASLIAKENTGKHQALYMTVNPVQPALLARNENKFEYGSHTTTTDAEIVERRWFLIDLDPKRPVGISSTQGELDAAKARAEGVVEWLTSIGWPRPIMASSGNGYHLMYRTQEPNDDETRTIWEFALKMIASIFSDDVIDIDTKVWNASRVWKIYGTVAAKGSSTEERPHRVAKITDLPNPLEVVSRGLLENVARPLKESKSDEFKDMTGEFISDMQKWLTDRGVTVASGPFALYGTEGKKWRITKCPWNANHNQPIVGVVGNRPMFRCLHNSCSAFRWKEFREKIDPTFKDPDEVYRRLKEWCDGDSEEIDEELKETACRTGKVLQSLIKKLKKEAPRARVLFLEDVLNKKRRDFLRETIGENNEKGNIVGLISRVRSLQADGHVPMFWTADTDQRIRVGRLGDVDAPRYEEADEISLMVRFHGMGDSWVKQTHCSQVIKHLASEHRINPLRVHLKEFRWDGKPRLDTWLIDFLGTRDTPYTRAIGRKWLISAAARAMEPGCQADHMLILEGGQGIGKSKALRALGGQFYTEYSGSLRGGGTGHKDMVAVICGKMIVEMSELASIKRAEVEALKAILTTTVDDARLSYERDAKPYPRTCVWAGTTNEVGQAYIADQTGARRFWPAVCAERRPVDVEGLKKVRDQLWAEAVEMFENGEDWYTVPQEAVLEEQALRTVTVEMDPWYQKLRLALTDPDSYANGVFHVRPEYVGGIPTGGFIIRAGAMHLILSMVFQVGIERQSQTDANRVRQVLRTVGFKKTRPENGWLDSSYAYDLKKEAVSHLWPAIEEAMKKQTFPMETPAAK